MELCLDKNVKRNIQLLLSLPSSVARRWWDLGTEGSPAAREQSPREKARRGYPLLLVCEHTVWGLGRSWRSQADKTCSKCGILAFGFINFPITTSQWQFSGTEETLPCSFPVGFTYQRIWGFLRLFWEVLNKPRPHTLCDEAGVVSCGQ